MDCPRITRQAQYNQRPREILRGPQCSCQGNEGVADCRQLVLP